MKLTNGTDYPTTKDRQRLARFLSAAIDGMVDDTFEPFKPNESDSTFWKLDRGNNWSLKFFDDALTVFEVRYRYQCAENRHEEALAGWLAVRMNAEIVKENNEQ